MRWQWWIIAVGSVLATGCAKNQAGGRIESAPGGVPVVFDSTVPQDQREAINASIERIAALRINDSSEARVLGVSDFSSATLTDWLRRRLRYITGQNFNVEQNTVAQQSSYYYRPEVFASLSSLAAGIGDTKVVTRMTNIGAAVYLDGMSSNQLSALNVAGERIIVNTPRVGVFQIGEGLFADAATRSAVVVSFNVGSTIYHEARHTDGNGAHVAFAHQTCPSWHDYAGSYACDNSTNGPYSVQYVLLKKFSGACAECDTRDREQLSVLIADRYGRILPGAVERDPSPERVAQ